MKSALFPVLFALLFALPVLGQAKKPPVPTPPVGPDGNPLKAPEPTRITAVDVKGRIDGSNIMFDLSMSIASHAVWQETPIVSGEVVLDKVTKPEVGYRPRYDAATHTYHVLWPDAGDHTFVATFAARAKPVENGQWREATFVLPAARLRSVEVTTDRTDLQVQFPGAMRVTRAIVEGKLVMTALLGPDRPFVVRWKPLVEVPEARLVLGSTANTIATVGVGALRMDTLFQFDVAQGSLDTLTFAVPRSLSITQVRGQHIRDWRIADPAADAPPTIPRTLTVVLSQPQTKAYAMQVLGEQVLSKLPLELDVPVIVPTVNDGGIRSGGQIVIGTDSAIQLIVKQTVGLSQIDGAGFAHVALDEQHPRPIPGVNAGATPGGGKAFFYQFAASAYQLKVALDDIVPAYDVETQVVATVGQDDLTLEARIELDVRDAPIRTLVLDVPAGLVVTNVSGQQIADYTVRPRPANAAPNDPQQIDVQLRLPVLGRALIGLRMELGRTTLGEARMLTSINVRGARSHRGHVVIAAEQGVQLEEPVVQNLRQVNTASAPIRVALAQFAYRLQDANWSLGLNATRKPVDLRVETFHLVTVGEGIAYGSVAANYLITGSPIDTFKFRVSERLQNVEFVGRDVRRWSRDENDPQLWTIELRRRVIGDYNLGVTYTQRYDATTPLVIGGVTAEGVQTQTGFMTVASHMDLKLAPVAAAVVQAGGVGGADSPVLEIDRQEVPANYRLLINAPILRTYKYVAAPHEVQLTASQYDHVDLPAAIVEIMQLETSVFVNDDGPTDSVTRVRYKVKNASGQFLSLSLPKTATIWTTRVAEQDALGNEIASRVTAAFDKQRGVLMVPLKRNRNPNDPLTVDVEYGLDHRQQGKSGPSRIVLEAPSSDVRSTFDTWRITAPDDWALLPDDDGNMIAEHRPQTRGDLSLVASLVGERWSYGFQHWDGQAIWYAVLAVGVIIIVTIFRRRTLPTAIIGLVLLALLWVGIIAANDPRFDMASGGQPDDYRVLTYTQAVNLDDAASLRVAFDVAPAWRQNAGGFTAFGIGAIAIACALLAIAFPKGRLALISLAVAAALYSAARFPAATPVLGHLLTWGLPTLVLIALAVRFVVRLVRSLGNAGSSMPAVATAAFAMLLFFGSHASAAPIEAGPTIEQSQFASADATMTVEQDSVASKLKLRIAASRPTTFTQVVDPSSIVLTPDQTQGPVRIITREGKTTIEVTEAGAFVVELDVLSPLDPADAQNRRTFKLPMPMALTNRVMFTIPAAGLDVSAPSAMRLNTTEAEAKTTVDALFGPRDVAVITWKPRERKTEAEKTVFFADVASAVRFDEGIVETQHVINFQIAQGQLRDVRLRLPDNMTVTAVKGASLGAWRFDPATHELEARLSQPATGEYRLQVVAQISTTRAPYDAMVGGLTVIDAVRQRGILGVFVGDTVHADITPGPTTMNVDDFTRDAAALIAALAADNGGATPVVRHAFRLAAPVDAITAHVTQVEPEFRSIENAAFSIADQRLTYNAQFTVQISKAGVFTIELQMPADYEVDTITAPQVSHWDDAVDNGVRTVHAHLKQRTVGDVPLSITLSRSVAQLPAQVAPPRVELVGARKHTGQIVIEAEQGVRLTIADRQGVSELNPVDLNIRTPGVLAFALLRPDWTLSMNTQVIEPRVNVDFLHVANVTEGVVRHAHYLRYRLYNAGVKTLDIDVPPDAMSLLINGPNIARRQQIEPGHWRIELTGKVFGKPYPLTVTYEKRFDRAAGQVALAPVIARGADLQRGHVAVLANERVELSAQRVGASLQPAEARSIDRAFGAGDLSAAAFCYASTTGQYDLALTVKRHATADLLEADVQRINVISVVADSGATINRVQMQLRVGSKRHLEVRLPSGSSVWSLMVNGRSTAPSTRTDKNGDAVVLVTLDQAVSAELADSFVDMIYVASAAASWSTNRQHYQGPQFDLPLRNLHWIFYLPKDFEYDDFQGTLAINENVRRERYTDEYNIKRYEQEVVDFNKDNRNQVRGLVEQGMVWYNEGKQSAAKSALQRASNYAMNDAALSEDTRVQLHKLMRDNALVGLLDANDRLRMQSGAESSQRIATAASPEGLAPGDLERIKNALGKEEQENLELITRRLIEVQESAAASDVQLAVQMPLRGRILQFDRNVQVQPNAEMQVSFAASRSARDVEKYGRLTAGGLFIVVFVLLSSMGFLCRRMERLRAWLAPKSDAGSENVTPVDLESPQ